MKHLNNFFNLRRPVIFLLSALLFCLSPAFAQEPLTEILTREHIQHWLVCGPFSADIPGGIVNAAANSQAALGSLDHMRSAGGMQALRPEHLLTIGTDDGEAIWQRAGTDSATLDLSPFFENAQEGIAYAAFYADAPAAQPVLMELHTMFGARVWHNGLQIRDAQARPLAAQGVDQFIANFTSGRNLLVFEVPGAALDALAAALGVPEERLATTTLANRDLLRVESGWEMALRMRPIAPLETIYYVPRLKATEQFSGAGSDLRQLAMLTLFNTRRDLSPPLQVTFGPRGSVASLETIKPIASVALVDYPLAVPIGGRAPGEALSVEVGVAEGDTSGTFTSAIAVSVPELSGQIHVLPMLTQSEEPLDQSYAYEQAIDSIESQLTFYNDEPGYGFDLGPAELWQAALVELPELRDQLRTAVELGEVAAWPAYSAPDQRIVAGETLARNLAIGISEARRVWGAVAEADSALSQKGIAPQWPQVIAFAGLSGTISDLNIAALPALFTQRSPGGMNRLHRRKQPMLLHSGLDSFRRTATAQAAEMLAAGPEQDVFVVPVTNQAPSFLASATAMLEKASPRFSISGTAAQEFFTALDTSGANNFPTSGRYLNAAASAQVVAQPHLKQAHSLAESKLLVAERIATLASMVGAPYPARQLDYAWRQVLYWSTPRRLGYAETDRAEVDLLAALRDVSVEMNQQTNASAEALALSINTLGAGPPGNETINSIIVFNPSSHPRRDAVRHTMTMPAVPGLRLTDELGETLPLEVEDAGMAGPNLTRATLRFVSPEVPPFGYRTLFLVEGQSVSRPARREDALIQNEFFSLMIDPSSGDVMSLVDKESGEEFAAGPLNRVLALELDPARSVANGDLWTTGSRGNTSGAEVETLVSDAREMLRIRSSLGGGTLVRELTLHKGLRRIDASLRLDGANLSSQALALTFVVPSEGRNAVFGERFGVVNGARSLGVLDYRISGRENPSGAAVYPAHRFAASVPGDSLRIGLDGAAPLQPAWIIHGEDPALIRAARALEAAMLRRGIPASTAPAQLRTDASLTSDHTFPATGWRGLEMEPGMRIVLGSPEQNAYCAELLRRQPDDVVRTIAERAPKGASALLLDNLGESRPPIPTLLVVGNTAADSAALGESIAEAIAASGSYVLAPAMDLNAAKQATGDTGLAVSFRGTVLSSIDQDGTLVLLPAIDAAPAVGVSPASDSYSFDYSIHPISQDWREAQLPEEALGESEPFTLAVTDLHGGQLEPSGSLLHPGEDFLVTALHPAGSLDANADPQARNGVIVRGHEAYGRLSRGMISMFTPIRSATTTDLLDKTLEPLKVDQERVPYELEPYALAFFSILPSLRGATSPLLDAKPELQAVPQLTRYWRHNAGTPPESMPPVLVTLHADATADPPRARIKLANRSRDTVSGAAQLQASGGWTIAPERVPYALRPGDFLVEELELVITDPSDGGVMARVESEGQVSYDFITLGPAPVEMRLTRTLSQIKAELYNTSDFPAYGRLDIVTTPEHWTDSSASDVDVAPHGAAVSIPPHEVQTLLFRVSNPDAALRAVAKLAANGFVTYSVVE